MQPTLFSTRFRPVSRALLAVILFLGLTGGPGIAAAALPDGQAAKQAEGDYVLLLHGIARSSRQMTKLEARLTALGFEVINLDYPSRKRTIEDLATLVDAELRRLAPDDRPLHIIGFSMGGLVARGLIRWHRPARLGRVVQLAPPNCGSEVADMLKPRWAFRKFYGPAGQQLGTAADCHVGWLGAVDYELGIIAGTRSIDPVSSLIIDGPDDGKVAVRHTRLDGAADHITLPATHTFFPRNRHVIEQAMRFLLYGSFRR